METLKEIVIKAIDENVELKKPLHLQHENVEKET